jgi:arginine-tRNA-protein transferase
MTAPSPCPYLPGRIERKVFTHLAGTNATALNDALSLVGFRRSQNIAYRPACQACDSCVSVRVPVADFEPGRTFRRIIRRNLDLTTEVVGAEATVEQYSVFRSYIDIRHHDGGMAEMNGFDFAQMVEESQVKSSIIEFRAPRTAEADGARGRLVAAVLLDRLADGLSMIYSFYRPEEATRSLGTYTILDTIDRARRLRLPYVYLGYWVRHSRKMGYKSRFLPQERLIGQSWRRVNAPGGDRK